MHRQIVVVVTVCCALLVSGVAALAQGPHPQGASSALGTAFTYQGQLKRNGTPLNSSCNLSFLLYADAAGVSLVAGPVNASPNPVTVTSGLFTVQIDFGANAFTGDARWLQTIVQCSGDSSPVPLTREPLTAVPYAQYSLDNWALNGNAGTRASSFLGTTDNMSLSIGVSNTAALRLLPNPISPIVIGGFPGNQVGGTDDGATIGGGGSSLFAANVVSGTNVTYSTIAGGTNNQITTYAPGSTIGGGSGNLISGTTSAGWAVIAGGNVNTASGAYSTVSGGQFNSASGNSSTVSGGQFNSASADYSTVSGGRNNTASQYGSTVSGGYDQTASGWASMVPGGNGNIAGGAYSFAGGVFARARHDGAFVWADSTFNPITSTANNQFIVRASGGITLYTNSSATSGATLLPGSNSWSIASDRNAKMNFSAVDGRAVLAALASIPVETWSYKTQDPGIRHMGPMAQDFHAAFGVGENDTTISTVDAQGVALAAIQGLSQIVGEQQEEIAQLKAQVSAAGQVPQPSSTVQADGTLPALVGLSLLMNVLLGAVLVVHLRKGGNA